MSFAILSSYACIDSKFCKKFLVEQLAFVIRSKQALCGARCHAFRRCTTLRHLPTEATDGISKTRATLLRPRVFRFSMTVACIVGHPVIELTNGSTKAASVVVGIPCNMPLQMVVRSPIAEY